MSRAKIIVIEGTDGSGKETQSKLLKEKLEKKGLKVKSYSFPIYESATGKIVGGSYLGKSEISPSVFEETSANVDPLVSCLYYAADRRYNLLKYIEDEIYKNDVIIFDRYVTSNMGHQAGKAKTKEQREKIINFIHTLEYDLCELPKPDIVVFLYMPLLATKFLRKDRVSDGNESNDEHVKNAESTYLYLDKKYDWYSINCLKSKEFKTIEDIKSIDEISNEINEYIDSKLNESYIDDSYIKRMTRF